MHAAVLSIGTELTRGELVDTNAAWLSEQLTALGFEVVERVTVDDHVGRIAEQVKRLAQVARVVISTGGLGPTSDDVTAEAVAKALGVGRARHAPTIERLRSWLEQRGRELTESNARQADLPERADALQNDVGTAPGFAVQLGQCRLFFTPGVPREMQYLYEERIRAQIAPLAERTSHQIHLRTFGLPESQLADQLDGLEAQFAGLVVGYRASFPEVEVKLLVRAADERTAQHTAEKARDAVMARIGEHVFGDRDATYAGYIGRTLKTKGLTLAVAESCTGGLVGQMLTSVPGSSEYLLLDAVTYSNAAKTSLLGVNEDILRWYGAVSEESASAMAQGALRICEADLSVAITGIAGPGGGTDQKPVGTVWLGAATRAGQVYARKHDLAFLRERGRIRTLSAYLALRMVERMARGFEP